MPEGACSLWLCWGWRWDCYEACALASVPDCAKQSARFAQTLRRRSRTSLSRQRWANAPRTPGAPWRRRVSACPPALRKILTLAWIGPATQNRVSRSRRRAGWRAYAAKRDARRGAAGVQLVGPAIHLAASRRVQRRPPDRDDVHRPLCGRSHADPPRRPAREGSAVERPQARDLELAGLHQRWRAREGAC